MELCGRHIELQHVEKRDWSNLQDHQERNFDYRTRKTWLY
jgi:hypothetical protein